MTQKILRLQQSLSRHEAGFDKYFAKIEQFKQQYLEANTQDRRDYCARRMRSVEIMGRRELVWIEYTQAELDNARAVVDGDIDFKEYFGRYRRNSETLSSLLGL